MRALLMREAGCCRAIVTILVVAALTWPAAAGGEEERPGLIVGLIPEMNVFEQADRFRLLAEFLSERVGVEIELSMLSRYGNIVERIIGKEVDAAFLGSFTGALASAQLGMEPVARPINLDGTSTYWGYLFVRRDSGIETVDQMRGRRLALVEKATTAGYVFPVAFFRDHGVEDLDRFFSEVQFWGSHDAAINAVLDGRADIGAAKNTIWEHLAGESSRVTAELSILATSPKVPSNGLFLSPEVEPSIRETIRSTLLDLDEDPAGAEVLAKLRARGFVPTDIASYEPVFELARAAGIDLSSYTYRNP
jgi:phosphonate transport system substrate-binding protein